MVKLITKIIKLGKSMFAIRINLNNEDIWGRFTDGALSAEQQFNVAKNLFTTNKDVEVEIEYTPIEDKKNVMISSIKEVVGGKVVEPSKEQTVKPKPKPKPEVEKTKDIGTPDALNAGKQVSKPSNYQNDTQTSIERQVASKDAMRGAASALQGLISPDKIGLDLLCMFYEKLFDSAIKKIQG